MSAGARVLTTDDLLRMPADGYRDELVQGELRKIAPAGWPGAPDLAVEVLAPSDTIFETEEKVATWLSSGTRTVWVVNPRSRTVTVHFPAAAPRVLSETDVLDGSDVVPGFTISIAEIFA